MSRPWTSEEDDTLRSGLCPPERSTRACFARRSRLGLTGRYTYVDAAEITRLVTEGLSTKDIAATMDVSYSTVHNARIRMGIQPTLGRPRKDKAPSYEMRQLEAARERARARGWQSYGFSTIRPVWADANDVIVLAPCTDGWWREPGSKSGWRSEAAALDEIAVRLERIRPT